MNPFLIPPRLEKETHVVGSKLRFVKKLKISSPADNIIVVNSIFLLTPPLSSLSTTLLLSTPAMSSTSRTLYNERTCTGPAAEKERTRKAASRSATTATVLGDQALKR